MKIAITGGIAEGKSTVLSHLAEAGFTTASSDLIARELLDMPEVQAAIAGELGLARSFTRDDLRLRLLDSEARRTLNRLMHPRILDRMQAMDAQFTEVPLLLEACLQGYFRRVWVVTCGLEEQRRRLERRLGSGHADELLLTQLTTRAKLPFADAIIRTNGDERSVKRFVTFAATRELC